MNEHGILYFQSSVNIKDKSQAKQFFLDRLAFYARNGWACLLGDLNRKFGKKLKSVGTSALEICSHLSDQGLVLVKTKYRKTWIIHEAEMQKIIAASVAEMNAFNAELENGGREPEFVDEYIIRQRAIDYLIDNAIKSSGI